MSAAYFQTAVTLHLAVVMAHPEALHSTLTALPPAAGQMLMAMLVHGLNSLQYNVMNIINL
jgi:hypothetical protein